MAAPFAGLLSKWLKPRTLMIMIAVVIGVLCVYNLARLGIAAAKARRRSHLLIGHMVESIEGRFSFEIVDRIFVTAKA
jgi:hypothetical protein